MRESVYQYLMENENVTEKVANMMCDKFEKHPDIMSELVSYIQNETFPQENPISVQGYTAEQIESTTYLKPVGAYNYLIYLRNKPETALENLKKGLPKR